MMTTSIYIITAISLLMFIYYIPGIALFPRFIMSPRTTATLPFISICIIVITQYSLSLIHQFNQLNIILLAIFLTIVAIIRIKNNLNKNIFPKNQWEKHDLKAFFAITFTSVPLMVILGLDAFQHADEIYSWNLWARKLYFGEEVIYESTAGAAYPLLLPSLIAFCYKFIGNIDYQLPIKFTFSIIYVSTVFSIYTFAKETKKTGIFFLSFILVVLIIGVGEEYKVVYADTLMGGFLVSAYALLFTVKNNSYNRLSSNNIFLASIMLVTAAALTKQAAIPWTMIFYPILAYYMTTGKTIIADVYKWTILIPVITPLLWYIIEGSGFQHNVGVIGSSIGARTGYIDQLKFSFTTNILGQPILFVFLGIVLSVLIYKINIEKTIIATSILSSTILWMLFGSYEPIRLFVHVLLFGWLVIFVYGSNLMNKQVSTWMSNIGTNKFLYIFIGILFLIGSGFKLNQKIHVLKPVTSILDGGQVQANWIIGNNGAKQYRNIINSGKALWVIDDMHIYGLYYGALNSYRGDFSTDEAIHLIKTHNTGWVYAKGNELSTHIQNCPQLFTKISTGDSIYNADLYKINNDIELCRQDNI